MTATEKIFWVPSDLREPPTDGRPFWAWLYQTGVRRMVCNADGDYVLADDLDEDYLPEFWAPIEAIPDPEAEWAHCREPAQ